MKTKKLDLHQGLVRENGLEAGFGSTSRFKRYSGQPPGQYRRRLQYHL